MAGDPAITKVSDALQELVAQLPGVNVFVDRPEDEPIQEEERPCVAIRIVDVQFAPAMGQSEMRHEVTTDLDFYEEVAASTGISRGLAAMVASFNALVAADRTLGGRLETFELRSATADLDAIPDLGCAVVTAELTFLTPRADFTTILGASGLF